MRLITAYISLFFLLLSAASTFAETSTDVWQPEAKAVCDQIFLAATQYQQGNVKDAHLTAVMSYFKGYDANIEPAVRVTLGGPHVFAVERQFRDYAAAITASTDKKQISTVKTLATALCQTVNDDAKALNEAKVKRQVFKVE